MLSVQRGTSESSALKNRLGEEMSLEDARIALGGEKLVHSISAADPEKVRLGQELILKGRTKKGFRKSKLISPYFVCTDCHNLNREFDIANDQNPESRLKYAEKHNLPFLPGSTFWGIYNRTSFYNDDYVKKYGNLITKAKSSLEESIQVCAKYCSAGRHLNDWEVEAILHYFKSTELKLKDLNLSDDRVNSIVKANQLPAEQKKKLLQEIDASYVHGFRAYFDETMPREKRKYGEEGDVQKGKFIYENACLFCHRDGRVTNLKLDDDKLSAQMFLSNMEGYSDKSIYQILRYGTYTMPGRNQYMPRYTKEKMSDEQINHLMAYLKELAKK